MVPQNAAIGRINPNGPEMLLNNSAAHTDMGSMRKKVTVRLTVTPHATIAVPMATAMEPPKTKTSMTVLLFLIEA